MPTSDEHDDDLSAKVGERNEMQMQDFPNIEEEFTSEDGEGEQDDEDIVGK
jgi:hypothetical protein